MRRGAVVSDSWWDTTPLVGALVDTWEGTDGVEGRWREKPTGQGRPVVP